MRKLAVLLGLLGLTFWAVQVTAQEEPVATHHVVQSGESWYSIARQYNVSANELARQNFLTIDEQLHPNHVLHVVPGQPPVTTTTTTVPETTTTTTVPPTTTTEPPATTTTTVPPSGGFVETFDTPEGLDRFEIDVHHRVDHDPPNFNVLDRTWRADHDHECGGADTERTVDALHPGHVDPYGKVPSVDRGTDVVYHCRGHFMTTMGDVDGYSVIAFSPDQVFETVSRVCWDQNVTDLGGRQWVEVVVTPADQIPVDADGTPHLAHVQPGFESVDQTASRHVQGTLAGSFHPGYSGVGIALNREAPGLGFYDPFYQADAAGFSSRAIRRQHCITQVGDNSMELSIDRGAGEDDYVRTFTGSFPENARVIFEDHNYTPDKDGEACRTTVLSGCRYTWHWDNIVVE